MIIVRADLTLGVQWSSAVESLGRFAHGLEAGGTRRVYVGVEDSRVTCEELVTERTAADWLNTDWLCTLFRDDQDDE